MLIRIRQRLQGEDGVSLVELLVSMVVLAVVMMGLLSTSVASLASVRTSEQRIRATALVNELLENVQAIPFGQVGFFAGDFGGDPIPPETVIHPGTRGANCSAPCRAPLPSQTGANAIVRDGMAYDVTREITWVNNPLTGGSEDYKRIAVTVTWDDGGRQRTQTAEALRSSPLISSEFVLTAFAVTPSLVYIDGNGHPQAPIGATATTTETPTTFSVSFIDRNGDAQSYPLQSVNGTDHSRTVPAGNVFRNGDTRFTFEATRGDETVEGSMLVRFVQPLDITVTLNPEEACIPAAESAFAPAVLVEAHVEGAVPEDVVTVTWPGHSGVAEHDGVDDVTGVTTSFLIPEGSYTETMTITVDVVRSSDGATASQGALFTLHRPEVCE